MGDTDWRDKVIQDTRLELVAAHREKDILAEHLAMYKRLVGVYYRDLAAMTAQRDDLLAALEGLVKGVDGFWESEAGLDRTLCTGAMADAVNRANTAIAKARGAK